MASLFISYSHEDKDRIQPVVRELQSLGHTIWIDIHGIPGGELWEAKIVKAIEECNCFLLFVSFSSAKSDNVRREVSLAYKNKKKIIPIRLEKVDIPAEWDYQTIGIQWIETDIKNWMHKLIFALGETQVEKSPKKIKQSTEQTHTLEFDKGKEKIIQKIEHPSYNQKFSQLEEKTLTDIYTKVDMKKKSSGEKNMESILDEYAGNTFLHSSRTLAYYLLSLSDIHSEWPDLSLNNDIKDDSLSLLKNLQDQVLISSTFIQQVTEASSNSMEVERIVTALHALKKEFIGIDKYLQTGNLPYDVSDEIDRHFDDLIFYLNKYILLLDNLARSDKTNELIQ